MLQQQPSRIPHPGRILVIGDVHGDIDRLMSILISTHIFSTTLEWIAEPKNTHVVQLGDQIDSLCRGGNPEWEKKTDIDVIFTMNRLDEIASVSGGRVISLIGNHEVMNMAHQFMFVSEKSMTTTGLERRANLFQPGTGVCSHILATRNIVVQIGPYLFCHGGIMPEHLELVNNDFDVINMVFKKYARAENLSPQEIYILRNCITGENSILWNRTLYNMLPDDASIELVMNNILQRTNTICMLVGHNTVEDIKGVANNKLFFVDAGLSRSYPFNRIQVLEINTNNSFDRIDIVELRNL
jgi:hypothetical protein